jgi:hypothetical protein
VFETAIDVLGLSQDFKITGWFSGGSAQISSFDTVDGRKLDSKVVAADVRNGNLFRRPSGV